ncbi:MAG: aldo/keto reductase [Gammaproteobacteria bacterium]|nr:aldo/keto reductase [Gammaproteobacteria bacterium]MDH3537220.1 aldo/keto reductase [Gammaproteobacteria bacterium]
MHSRNIGSLEVSSIGLGCMSMSMGYGPADDKISAQMLNVAIDAGYRMLDTAAMYGNGHNEILIGNTLAHRRDEYVLASKGGFVKSNDGKPIIDGSARALQKGCEESLKRLQTDVIDLYYLHRLDKNIPVEESVAGLAALVASGKVRAIGLSEVSSETLRRAHAIHPIAAVQSEYSLWSRTPEARMLQTCEELGVTFVAFSPLARAFLAGAAKDVTQLPPDDIRCTNARPRFEPENFVQNQKLLKPYAAIADRAGCSMAQLALAWLLGQINTAGARTIVPIPGTKHPEYAVENAGAGDIELDQVTLSELDELINENTVSGCRYTNALMESIDSERDRDA